MPVTSSVARTGMPRPPTAPSRGGSTPPSAIPYTERAAATRSSRTVFAVAASAITVIARSAFGPRTRPATSARGAVDVLRSCQPTAAVTERATSR